MKKTLVFVVVSIAIMTTSSAYAFWSSDRTIKSVLVGDACGEVDGQYALITDNKNYVYWITSEADNFENVVAMAQLALVEDLTVNFYSRYQSYRVGTNRNDSGCWTGSNYDRRLSILSIK